MHDGKWPVIALLIDKEEFARKVAVRERRQPNHVPHIGFPVLEARQSRRQTARTGVAAATTPDYGDVVLAEHTLPFNEGDITYFRPLYHQCVLALDHFPTHITADAAL